MFTEIFSKVQVSNTFHRRTELKIKKNHQPISSVINKFAKTKTRKVKYN